MSNDTGQSESSEEQSDSLQSRWQAIVLGEDFTEWPQDLYIPPDALEVFLDAFEGPLDLLLWLIRKQNIDILDIPVAEITTQYMRYVEMMQQLRLDLAAEYLVMAATLAEIKSRMMLPRPEVDEEDERDPRAVLVARLQEYERFKLAAQSIDELPRLEREIFVTRADFVDEGYRPPPPDLTLDELVKAFQNVLEFTARNKHFVVGREVLSIRERMVTILQRLRTSPRLRFIDMIDQAEGRLGVVVTFSAILELSKEASVSLVQEQSSGPIYVDGLSQPATEETLPDDPPA